MWWGVVWGDRFGIRKVAVSSYRGWWNKEKYRVFLTVAEKKTLCFDIGHFAPTFLV